MEIEVNYTSEQSKSNTLPKSEDKEKVRTNLEFLLSQNDILPLLKKINRERGKSIQDIWLDKFVRKVYF
jgi:hypothetical protein